MSPDLSRNGYVNMKALSVKSAAGPQAVDSSLPFLPGSASAARSLTPSDLSTEVKVAAVLQSVMSQAGATPAASALVPWVCDVLPSLHSRKAYLDDLRMFLLHMKDLGVHPFSVTGDHVRIYKEALSRAGKKTGTIARALSVIRGTYEQFGKKGLVPWNIVGDIKAVTSPRVEKNTTPALSEAEAKRLLHAPDENTLKGARDFAMLFTYFMTACRCSALITARVGDIEKTDQRFYLVVREKGGKTQRKALLDADAPCSGGWKWRVSPMILNRRSFRAFPGIRSLSVASFLRAMVCSS